jgi:hypothetical protein
MYKIVALLEKMATGREDSTLFFNPTSGFILWIPVCFIWAEFQLFSLVFFFNVTREHEGDN